MRKEPNGYMVSVNSSRPFQEEVARAYGEVEVVSPAKAEEADVVVCILKEDPTRFTDNEFGQCTVCGVEVQFRPYAPKKPPRVCYRCVETFTAERN